MSNPTSPTPPIVLDDNGDLDVYPSVEDACSHLEVYEVLDGTCEAFDSRGFRLRIETSDFTVIGMWADLSTTPEPEEVERRLRRLTDTVGADRIGLADPDAAGLPELLAALLRFHEGGGPDAHKGSSVRATIFRRLGGLFKGSAR